MSTTTENPNDNEAETKRSLEANNNSRLESVKMPSGLVRNVPKVETLPEDFGRHMSLLYANPVAKKFRFPGADGEPLEVTEVMAECKIFASVPSAYLQLVSDWMERRLANIQRLTYSFETPEDSRLTAHIQRHRQYLAVCHKCVKHLRDSPPTFFKPSDKKTESELQFLPTNLHIERLMVVTKQDLIPKYFDFFTSGCFAAIPMGHKGHLGLLSAQKKLQELVGSKPTDLQIEMCRLEGYKHQLEELRSQMRSIAGLTSEFNSVTHSDCVTLLVKTVKQTRQLLAGLNEICDRLDLVPVVNDLYSLYISRRLSLCAARPSLHMEANGHSDSNDHVRPSLVVFSKLIDNNSFFFRKRKRLTRAKPILRCPRKK